MKGGYMKTVAIISRKGGTGKTATCGALGAGLMRRGKKVLFVDLDSQANLSFTFNAFPRGPATNAMMLLKEYCTAIEAIWKQKQGDIIPAVEDLAGADLYLKDIKGGEFRLRDALKQIENRYDFCIIDTPSQLGSVTVNALAAANYVIVPVQAEMFSLQGLVLVNSTINSVKEHCNQDLKVSGILVTRYKYRTTLSQDMKENLEEAAQQLNTKVFNTTIRETIAVAEAQAQQQDLFSYAPHCTAAQDYDAFIDEFLKGE